MSQFPSIATTDGTACLPDPADPATFGRCKLDWSERERNAAALALHKDLLRIRREDPVLRAQRMRGLDGAVLSEHAFVLRYFGESMGDRLLVINFGARLHASPIPEPLLAPSRGGSWRTVFSTESPKYGGWGTPPLETISDGWWIPAECAVLLTQTDATTPPR
jgi:maltooligosyltrehalose trehalohydrolase